MSTPHETGQAPKPFAAETGSASENPSIRAARELVETAALTERIIIRQMYSTAVLLGRIKWAADVLESGEVSIQIVVAEMRALHRSHCAEMDAEYGIKPNKKLSHG